MSLNHSPSIVTDGLVLCLDAANKRSYPGTGTTWTDLKGGNNGTLTNGPTFDSGNSGSIVFDGSDDYVNCGNGSDFSITEQVTLICWMKKTDKTSNSGYHHLVGRGPTSNIGYTLATAAGTGYPIFQFSTNGGNQWPDKAAIFSVDVCTGDWTMVTGSYNSNTSTVLIGVNDSFYTQTETGTMYNSTANVEIGRRSGVGQYYPANIAAAIIYNRALTADEIRQNYEATKGRYT